jgi:hypothetical protein
MDHTPDPRVSRESNTVYCAKKSRVNVEAVGTAYLPTHWTTEAIVLIPE